MSNSITDNQPPDTASCWLAGGGKMGALIRSMDWSDSPLGPIDSWPQILRTIVNFCLASNLPMSIAWGSDRTQIYNDGYCAILGAMHPASMGQDFKKFQAAAWPMVGGAFEKAFAGETHDLENRRIVVTRNGYPEEAFFAFSFSPIRDETGSVAGVFHAAIETTPQALAAHGADAQSTAHSDPEAAQIGAPDRAISDIDQHLQRKEPLRQTDILRMALHSMSEGVIVCGEKGELILVNQAAAQLLNLDDAPRDIRSLAAGYDWCRPDGIAEYSYDERPLVRALNGESVTDIDAVIRCTEKNVNLAVNCSAAPLTDASGRIVGAVSVFRNVGDSKRALQELHNAEQHFKLLVEGTTDYAIFMLDANGHIVSWNPGAQRILGYEKIEVIGKHVSLFYTPEDIAKNEPQRKLRQTVEEGRAEEDSWRVRKDGQRFWATGVLDALHDEHGRVRGFVKIMRDNTQRRLAEENTYFLANHDALTGLPNRTRFMERLNEALMNADRDDTQVAVLLLDLDRFKLINDTLGHHVGDMLLKKVAHRLSKCIRETDTVARLGGDEFVVILTRVKELAGVEALAGKIVQEMARPYHVNRQEIRSGTSLGFALYRKDGSDAGELLQKADLAMYRAKSSGRNHYRIFAPSMLTEVQIRREQEDSLRHALEYQEFELSFQPQIDLDTLQLSGAEVLLRCKNRVLQAIPIGKIIALAEETGLIIPLGEWILQTACRQMMKWQKMGFPGFKVAVNFSSAHLLAPNFIEMVRRILAETGLEAKYLELEVTEGLLVAASVADNKVMTALKEIGVSISVDDFGTGFSALSYLKNFPVDVLKLDGSLVRNLPSDLYDVAIVSAIIKLALDLNIKVIAEGVETADQLTYLKTTDCSTAQGFLFSPAVRTEKFEALLHSRKWSAAVFH